jgi:Peptidase S24-like.
MKNTKEKMEKEDGFWVNLARDAIVVIVLLGMICGTFYLTTGLISPMVAVEGHSMEPHIHQGDLVFIVSPDKYGNPTTYLEGKEKNYVMFGDYGDVIVYIPDGNKKRSPVIHRAMIFLDKGERVDIGINGIEYMTNKMPHEGYLTKGDNEETNRSLDQPLLSSPVKNEWITGVARFKIPCVGYLSIIPRRLAYKNYKYKISFVE